MSRTAHHVPPSRGTITDHKIPGSPWHSVVIYDHRYSAAVLAEAARAAARPRPQPVRRAVGVYVFPRHNRDRGVVHDSALEERRARQRLRARTGLLRRLVNSADGTLRPDAADTVDIPPARHRHNSIWHA
ncbi:hypothetical protein ABZ208_32405 [Streptomyces sp. NPDC006208]|uniref:hypothetical protein n=1 Tax=Streptomyces sp. NPDC006208 TaxID=3156734 RepID=UPI0033B8F725